ncbi:helix-turn-helix domain-containing protein [Natrialbaceae archaeon A-arb3/5]
MTRDDSDDRRGANWADEQPEGETTVVDEDGERVRDAAVEEVDQRIVDLLSWILDTETRAKIYIHLLANPGSTSEEVAKGTGLYPSTVREALAELHEEERVTREKRSNEGAGNNPYEYTAIQPSDLVGGVVDQVQQELNTIFTLDSVLDREQRQESDLENDSEPITITVDESTPSGLTDRPTRTDESDEPDEESTGTDIDISEPDDEDEP